MDGASYSEDAEVRFVTGRRAWFGMVACCAHIITPTQRVGGTTGVELDFVFIYGKRFAFGCVSYQSNVSISNKNT